MRNLVEVIDKVLEIVPQDKKNFISQLKSIQASAGQSAQELNTLCYQMAELFTKEMPGEPPFAEAWQNKLVDLWMDK